MNLLAIETSTEFLSLALVREERWFARHTRVGQSHAETILDGVHALLSDAGIALGDIGGIAYGAGPGSFTGLRIACGVVQGLALPRAVRVLGVCTLLALAEEASAQDVITCIDARMGQVYHAAYRKSAAGWREIVAPGLHDPENVPLVPGSGWVGCGSGFASFGEALARRLQGALVSVRGETMPTAAAILRIAKPRFEAGEGDDPGSALPLYLRDKVALKKSEQ